MNLTHSALSLVGRALASGKLSILIYHQVLDAPDPMRPTEPTADIFEWQMALLARHCNPMPLADAVQHLREGSLPANTVCVTFDDGYVNNLTVAQPILEKYQIPATVYVATAFSRGENMWNDRVIHLFSDPARETLQLEDRVISLGSWEQRRSAAQQMLNELKYLPVEQRLDRVATLYQTSGVEEQAPLMMNPGQIRALSERGVEIGAHTVNHPILKELDADAQRREIDQSKADLESWVGQELKHFAYPNGIEGRDLDGSTVQHVQQAGFDTAVVTTKGTSDKSTSPFLLRRFTPWDRIPFRFHLRLVHNQVLS
ncbi:polysaccharide deacetylase [Kineobactrum sediminis]|uniref:Polysaccharide deacetylase n=1 Tax=Kineobactrum sediminis TaxID=1905677 RepID=A0A2N5XZF8_9GAMM|nr:polysaccharide deacetylase family protein [Kineobactrum sediminis]PLW81513.1 polysaccharide deacetylase [Kineobactrum sediminis]